MTIDQLRARLSTPTPPCPPSTDPALPVTIPPPAIAVPVGSTEARNLTIRPPVAAAVLVGFVTGATPGVLLTLRTAHLSSHAGQVSFPGGRIDPSDRSPEDAALREAHEEIGLDPARVELAGRLDDLLTGTGYRITPVLGLIEPGLDLAALDLCPSAAEVAAMFTLPLSVVLDPDAPQRRRAEFRGRWREFWVWPHAEHYIWGATAAILVDVAARLRATA